MRITVVTPVYNEEKGIEEFFRRCFAAVAALPHQFSFTAVNDGSSDASLQKLQQIKEVSPYPLTIVDLSRNFGHANALTAGIQHADGDAVIIIDADLEDPPELIPDLIREHEKGKDVVYTVKTRREDTIPRRIAFRIFHAVFSRMTNLDIPEGSGSFCLMSRQFTEEFNRLQESNRFIPGLRSYVGFDAGYVSYTKERRFAGLPKQTFLRLVDLSLNAFFQFSNAPIRTCTWLTIIGVLLTVIAMAAGSGFVAVNLFPLLSIIVLLQLWIIAVMVFKAQMEVLRRPTYIVKKIY